MKKSAYQVLHSVPAIYVKFKHCYLEKGEEGGTHRGTRLFICFSKPV